MPQGHVQVVGGVHYYSPNCTRTLTVAPQRLPSEGENPFHPAATFPAIVVEDLQHVRHWSPNFGWLAFLPLTTPPYRGYPLKPLVYVPQPEQKDHTAFGLPSRTKNSWMKVGSALYQAVVILKSRYRLHMILPHLPWGCGFLRNWPSPEKASEVAHRSHGWFTVWLTALSYCIAAGEGTMNKSSGKQHPDWFDAILNDSGRRKPTGRSIPSTLVQPSTPWDPRMDFGDMLSWLDGIRTTFVVDFKNTERVGCIIDIIHPPPSQPEVKWFIECNVPVWYRWDVEENSLASQDLKFAALAPPPSLLPPHFPRFDLLMQENPEPQAQSSPHPGKSSPARPIVTDTPAPLGANPEETLSDPPANPAPIAEQTVTSEPPWVEHFRQHERLHARMEARENPQQRQSRLDRAKNPPESKVRVFEWLRSGEGASLYNREAVTVRHSQDTLDGYKPGQKVYDSFCKEWNCCPDWPVDESSQDQAFYDSDQDEDGYFAAIMPHATYEPVTAQTMEGTPQFEGPVLPPPSSAVDDLVMPVEPPPMLPNTQRLEDRHLPPPASGVAAAATLVAATQGPGSEESNEVSAGAEGHVVDTLTPGNREEVGALVQDEQEVGHATHGANHIMPTETLLELECDVFNTLRYSYGICRPLPDTELPQVLKIPTSEEVDSLLRILGLHYDEVPQSFFSTESYCLASTFFNCIIDKVEPPTMYDLNDTCAQPLRLLPRLRRLRTIQLDAQFREKADAGSGDNVKTYFLFQPTTGEVRVLVLLSAPHALTVARMPDDWTQDDIAFSLLQQGIPFRIFVPSRLIIRRPFRAVVDFPIPTRKLSHVFTLQDYRAYIEMRTLLLGQPHMRAALRRGGIIWRLAIGTLGLADGLGISASAGGVLTIAFRENGELYQEDGLSLRELDLLCGLYECISDDGTQIALKSWWPLCRYYEKPECGDNVGRWNARREKWYIDRLQDIEQGNAHPMTYKEWKSCQHGTSRLRKFNHNILQNSLTFIDTHTPRS